MSKKDYAKKIAKALGVKMPRPRPIPDLLPETPDELRVQPSATVKKISPFDVWGAGLREDLLGRDKNLIVANIRRIRGEVIRAMDELAVHDVIGDAVYAASKRAPPPAVAEPPPPKTELAHRRALLAARRLKEQGPLAPLKQRARRPRRRLRIRVRPLLPKGMYERMAAEANQALTQAQAQAQQLESAIQKAVQRVRLTPFLSRQAVDVQVRTQFAPQVAAVNRQIQASQRLLDDLQAVVPLERAVTQTAQQVAAGTAAPTRLDEARAALQQALQVLDAKYRR